MRYWWYIVVLIVGWMPCRGQQPAPEVIVREVQVRETAPVPAPLRHELDTLTTAQIGQPYHADALREQVLELGVYQQVTLATENVEGGVRVVITVTPNPVVREITFTGNTALPPDELRALLSTTPGMVLDARLIRRDVQAIRDAYNHAGYPLVDVTDVGVNAAGVLHFTIVESTISEIRIEGNERTSGDIIARALTVRVGQPYSIRNVQQSLTNLQRLGIFQDVTVATEPGIEPGTRIVIFTVTEARTGFVGVGGSYGKVGGFSGYVSFTEANWAGRAQRVSLLVQVGARQIYQASYANPFIDRHQTSLDAAVYSRENLHAAVFGEEEFEYGERRRGGTLTVGRPVNPVTRVYATARVDSINPFPHNDQVVPAILLQPSDVRSLALSGVRDTRLNPLYPVQGSFTEARVEQAGIFGGSNFTRLSGETRRYWVVRRIARENGEQQPWVFAARLLAGVFAGSPPLTDQFLVGGTNTLRGFLEDRYPGERQVLLNTELRVPFSESLHGVAFVDAGDAWGGPFADAFGDSNFTLHTGYGLGLRVATPVGLLRLDYAFSGGEDGNQFHFGLGPMF